MPDVSGCTLSTVRVVRKSSSGTDGLPFAPAMLPELVVTGLDVFVAGIAEVVIGLCCWWLWSQVDAGIGLLSGGMLGAGAK